MRVIPAIDLIGGKCVRLHKGEFDSMRVYSDDPVEMARRFEDHGITHLHLVDLDGARAGAVSQLDILQNIADATNLIIDFGGGVKTARHVADCLNAGARQVTAGSIAAKTPEVVFEWIDRFGSDAIVLGADARDRKIAISGWMDTTELDIHLFIEMFGEHGIRDVISTDVDVDGTLAGPSYALYRELVKRFPKMNIIASGGVGSMKHLHELSVIGVHGVIVGKAIYEGRISLNEISELC